MERRAMDRMMLVLFNFVGTPIALVYEYKEGVRESVLVIAGISALLVGNLSMLVGFKLRKRRELAKANATPPRDSASASQRR